MSEVKNEEAVMLAWKSLFSVAYWTEVGGQGRAVWCDPLCVVEMEWKMMETDS